MTRDKVIEEVKNYENYPHGLSKECRDYILKALEQETVSKECYDHEYFLRKEFELKIARLEQTFDKIRAEIEKLQKMCDKNDLNLMAQYSAFGMVLDILDKYKAESESQESEKE